MPLPIHLYKEAIADFCRRWGIVEFAIFGSALRDDFRPDSDVDVLVSFAPGMQPSFQQWLTMIEELENMFGRKVALVERRTVEASKNYIRRKHILNHLEQVHVAG
ncbi:DNA polymerase subunit beta [Litorilinea aerophila]|uniref:Nucleotidyltransferase family protein n=1 Tax=Litorilinea aerophila TaxID=1204385 RepID=A0A540VL93_9CHLR|nr:DNA polymerase subunit beta [Litorilinea aerophila]